MIVKVSFVLSVYNEYDYIEDTLNSIFNQTFENFEIVLVDDSCSLEMTQILEQYSNREQLNILRNQKNLGLTKSLNKAIEFANGEYIARIDADDMCLPNRCALQVAYLNNNPNIVLVGGGAILIDDLGNEIGNREVEANSTKIKNKIYFKNMFIHPSVMFRKNIFQECGGYNENKKVSQDYDLWFRLLKTKSCGNLNLPLIKYRIRGNSITSHKNVEQRINAIKLIFDDLYKNGKKYNLEQFCWGNLNIIKSILKIIIFKIKGR